MNKASKNPRKILAWCLYDFANSSYSAVITAVVFPVYYTQVVVGNNSGDAWWGNAVSVSMILVALSSPLLGAISDELGIRRRLFIAYTLVSATAVASFATLQKGMALEGFLLFVLANFAMEGALVFYNAFLPEITDKDTIGRVSAWGFGLGYLGSVLSLLLALFLTKFNIAYVWLLTACFFVAFALPAFVWLPSQEQSKSKRPLLDVIKSSLSSLRQKLKDKSLRRFILAYLLYEDGVSTVIVFSSVFAVGTLGFDTQSLVLLYILVQVSALVGSFVFAKPIDRWSAKGVIVLSLCVWIVVCVWGYFVSSKAEFFALALTAGLVLGSVQSASRAMFAYFIPHGREGEYFGLYSLVGKTSAILGPMLFGFVSVATSSQRLAVLSVAVFFVLGLLMLCRVRQAR